MIFTVQKDLVTTFPSSMRDLSLRQAYSFLQSKMAHLAMNGLLLQGRGLSCLLLLPLSSSDSLKVIHCYYTPNAPDFFPRALTAPSETSNGINTSQQHCCFPAPHCLLYFRVISFPKSFQNALVLHYSQAEHGSQGWANAAHNIDRCNIILTIPSELSDERYFSPGPLPSSVCFH